MGCAWVDRMSSAFAREHNELFYYSECRMEWTIVEWGKTRQDNGLCYSFLSFHHHHSPSSSSPSHVLCRMKRTSPVHLRWIFNEFFCQMQLTAIGQRRVNSFLDAELNSFVASTFAMCYAIAPINSNSLYDERRTDRPLRVRIHGHATLVCQWSIDFIFSNEMISKIASKLRIKFHLYWARQPVFLIDCRTGGFGILDIGFRSICQRKTENDKRCGVSGGM